MRSSLCRLSFLLITMFGAHEASAVISVERSVGTTQIAQVASLPGADLIILDAGFEAGFREGMVCRVIRGEALIGELLLVDMRPSSASALILDLASGQTLSVGDMVAVKTVSSRN